MDKHEKMHFELCVVGGGPAGFSAALAAGNAGLKTVLIEKDRLGGTCLNIGCVPSKALFKSAMLNRDMLRSEKFGFIGSFPRFDWPLFQKNAAGLISQLRTGMKFQLAAAKVSVIYADAEFIDDHTVSLDDGQSVEADNFIVATGGTPAAMDGTMSIADFWNLQELPEQLAIIGGGAVGCELASMLNLLGVKVGIYEKQPNILSGWDAEVVRFIGKDFEERGIAVVNDSKELPESLALNATGCSYAARPLPQGPHIHIVGDATGGARLASKAEYEGSAAVDMILNGNRPITHDWPRALFTTPEVAMYGLTEEECLARSMSYDVEKRHYAGNVKAILDGEDRGWIKLLRHSETGKLLGVHIVGVNAPETIQRFSGNAYVHPTLSEMSYF